jgi:uncharacterized protein YkwD
MTRILSRPTAVLALAVAIAVPLAGPALVAADATTTTATTSQTTPDLTVAQAEAAMVVQLNKDRTDRGIPAVRLDSRLMTIARARSVDMATKGYFDHRQPDGRTAFDMISAARIAWLSAGEIIAWNNWPTLASSVGAANLGWLGSPDHYAILTDRSYNSLGVGLAIDPPTGKKLWTAIFVREPVSTGAMSAGNVVAAPSRPGLSVRTAYGRRIAYLRWSAASAPTGVASYQVQRRVGRGAWVTLVRTTARSLRRYLRVHHLYSFRVRASDRQGHVGAWSGVVRVRT